MVIFEFHSTVLGVYFILWFSGCLRHFVKGRSALLLPQVGPISVLSACVGGGVATSWLAVQISGLTQGRALPRPSSLCVTHIWRGGPTSFEPLSSLLKMETAGTWLTVCVPGSSWSRGTALHTVKFCTLLKSEKGSS